MIREGAQIVASGEDVVDQCDVCVIGSGCGGATLAAALAERGYDVVILEQGGYYTAADFDQRELNSLAKLDGGRGLDLSDRGAVQLTYGNNVGGASVHYWADSFRLPADRLRLWEERFGLVGHGADVLAGHFEAVERALSVEPAPDALVNRMNALVREGAERLGWEVARVPQARKGCVSSGYCHQGCAYDAKQSQIVTGIPRAIAAGARLYTDCRAKTLRWGGRRVERVDAVVLDRATGLPTGRMARVAARAVVVAAGGFTTPLFLLAQGMRAALPQLGEHFFCNPCPMVHARFDEDIVQWRNIPAAWGVGEFRLPRFEGDEDGEISPYFGQQGRFVEGGYLLMANQLQPALLAAALPGVGAAHRRLMRDARRLGGTICWIDDAEEGRLSWAAEGKRHIEVPLDGGNGLRIRDALRKQATLLLEVGAREVIFGDTADTRISSKTDIEAAVASIELRPGRMLFAAPHPGGGARMGASPQEGVVGFDHRVHDTDNLYVADPSVFPTPPSVDPSLTIMAFSLVAADAVAAALG